MTIGNLAEKPWGTSVRTYLDDHIQVEWIHVVNTGYSSIHKHRHKVNLFIVHEGSFDVRIFTESKELVSTTHLGAGQSYVVGSGIYHQFMASTSVAATETYWAEGTAIDVDDIERISDNGRCVDSEIGLHGIKQYYLCSGCNRHLNEVESWRPAVHQGAIRPMCDTCLSKSETR